MITFRFRAAVFAAAVFFAGFLPVSAQSAQTEVDAAALVGLSIEELLRAFGVPRSVAPSRGVEAWQDDVVFVYDYGDFYIHRDRVWQVGVKRMRGISTGERRGVVQLVLGDKAVDHGDSTFYPVNEKPFPMMIRFDSDKSGRLQAIFVYRTDL
jgi:hypothetical protein